MDTQTVISVVVPLDNDGTILASFLKELDGAMLRGYQFFEIILVDNASPDETPRVARELLSEIPRLRYLRMSRPFDRDVLLAAGLESTIGDYVVTLDPASDPPSAVLPMIEACRKSGGILQGVATNPMSRGRIREFAGGIFRNYCGRQLGLSLRRGADDFRVMSRQSVNSLLQIKEQHRYLKILTLTLGYHHAYFAYERRSTAKAPRAKPLATEASMAIDLIASHSRHPLRVVTMAGLVGALLNLAYAIYVLGIFFMKQDVMEGWTTLSLQQSGMFLFICLILAVLGEYVGTILGEVRSRPLYFISEDAGSSVLLEDTVASSIVKESGSSEP
ncbi:MAG: glycosyltransferase [Akkermansiaceae bacterium]|nr:glycosyltransferase [Akkermansiaceae bacterium]